MLDRYFLRPDTLTRIRSSWIGEAIVTYVTWLTEQDYAARTVYRRVPILMRFGAFAQQQGARQWTDLPAYVQPFVTAWHKAQGPKDLTAKSRNQRAPAVANPIRQMPRLVVADFQPGSRPRKLSHPFPDQVPHFFEYLCQERGLRQASLRHYSHWLREFAAYLKRIKLKALTHLSPPVLAGFITDLSPHVAAPSLGQACGVLRVFLRYLAREQIVPKDLSPTVEAPQAYRLAKIPRSITWDEVRRLLEAVDRRTPRGKRDYAILLLLVTYGLRGHEITALTLDSIDWRSERLRIPERKAGHSTAYPLSPIVGQALVDYLQHGRRPTTDRHIFLRVLAPYRPLTSGAISGIASAYLHKAGIAVPQPGSHTLRHTCVQRLVDQGFALKVIGDYVGHRVPASTEIYSKVDIEGLREVAQGAGEDVL
jgi:site-specific recombinase XerD